MGMPAEWGQLLADQAKPRTGVHVTSMLSCPRRAALARNEAAIQIDRLEARLNGQLLHWGLGRIDSATAEWPVHGRLGSVPIVGSADRVRKPAPGELSVTVADGLRVFDYKGERAGGKSKRPDGAYPEQVWQLECYRYLLAQQGLATVGWTLWFRYGADWLDFSHDGPVWKEEALTSFRPHGSAWSALELARLTDEVERGKPAADIPLIGLTMKIGKGVACDWCEVEAACKQMAETQPLAVEF